MNRTITAIVLFGALGTGAAGAQTNAPATSAPTQPPAVAPPMVSDTTKAVPLINSAPEAGSAPAAPAHPDAATTTSAAPPGGQAVMPPPNTPTVSSSDDKSAPVPGANSFTQEQAKSRIQEQGYTGVGELVKDQNSIWRGKALKDGRTVDVALDYKGNVVAR